MNNTEDSQNLENTTSKTEQPQRSSPRLISIFALISAFLLIWMLQSILVPFIFACIFAALTWPLRNKLLKITKNRPNLTSSILILGMLLGIGAPVFGILLLALGQAQDFLATFRPAEMKQWLIALGNQLDHLPLANQLGVTTQKIAPKLQDGLTDIASWGMNLAVGLGSNVLHTMIVLGITLMSLFYLYVSGDSFVFRVKNIVPLPDSQVSELLDVFRRTSKAIFKGNFVIGAVQGTLTGLLFWGTGLPSPAFFGVVAALASLIPAVGTGLVWGPAAIFLFVSGDFTQALVVLGVGVAIISTLDSILRPVLVGRDAGMHDLMVFLTTLGGISFFGPIGVLFGPLVGAGALAMLRLYEESQTQRDQ